MDEFYIPFIVFYKKMWYNSYKGMGILFCWLTIKQAKQQSQIPEQEKKRQVGL